MGICKMANREIWCRIAAGQLRLGMICAGTGVTPCVQALAFVIEALQSHGDSATRDAGQVFGLLTSNRYSAGPLMLEEICRLEARASKPSVVIQHTLTLEESPGSPAKRSRQSTEEASYFTGRISREMLAKTLPPPGNGDSGCTPCLIVVTGPLGFAEHCTPLLMALGHPRDMVFALDA